MPEGKRVGFDLFFFCASCWFFVDFQERMRALDDRYVAAMDRLRSRSELSAEPPVTLNNDFVNGFGVGCWVMAAIAAALIVLVGLRSRP